MRESIPLGKTPTLSHEEDIYIDGKRSVAFLWGVVWHVTYPFSKRWLTCVDTGRRYRSALLLREDGKVRALVQDAPRKVTRSKVIFITGEPRT